MYTSAVNERMTRMGLVGLGLIHELNTPLATTALALELMAERFEGPAPPTAATAAIEVRRVLARVRRMGDLVHRLRALAKGQPIAPEHVDLDTALDSAARLTRSTLSEMAMPVKVICTHGPEPTQVLAEPMLLERAILLLALNAAEATAGLNDQPDCPTVWIGRYASCLTVRDNGPGFGDLGAAQSLGESTKGTMGVGLNFAQLIVAQLGGRLRLGNHPDGGALARIELPTAD
ncbi:MAG: two-component system C4-dicarboxylate transport sensor histidine kinase DctB [Bradymonadia bacterium]|jgi:two-component system C4-dicarboxylate transport sensor histidine kinase DctB